MPSVQQREGTLPIRRSVSGGFTQLILLALELVDVQYQMKDLCFQAVSLLFIKLYILVVKYRGQRDFISIPII